MKKKVRIIIHLLLLFIFMVTIVGSLFARSFFSETSLEEIMFYLTNGFDSADASSLIFAIKICLPIVLLIYLLLVSVFYDISFGKFKWVTKKGRQIYPFPLSLKVKRILTAIMGVAAILLLLLAINFYDYVVYFNTSSTFIEDRYIDPTTVDINFKKKNNLIIIYVESLETSLFSKEHGGSWSYDVIPELYDLLNEDDVITFYNEDITQAYNMIQGSSWTTASIVANSSGLPFKIRTAHNNYHSDVFMNGAYTLGDLLKDNGYKNEVISGATTSFGGIKEYYTLHGDFDIYDLDSLEEYGYSVTYDDYGKWGFNDNYLFELAKKRLDVLSQSDQPFDLQLITIDTHFIDGFVGNYSETKYKTQYENAYATTSRLIYEFINWVREQPYYEDTTIVILGDHLSMQDDFFKKHKVKKNNRYVYGCIINSVVSTENNKNRIVTALDSYPTIVAAMGGEIDGDRLGLGVNLFSGIDTLAEEVGLKYLNNELKKKSLFYNDIIMNDVNYSASN